VCGLLCFKGKRIRRVCFEKRRGIMEVRITMIELTHGNLLEADVEALVNTVNSVGVMGKGVALQFKKAFPENLRSMKWHAQRGKSNPAGCSS
jgi:hypothetical protein